MCGANKPHHVYDMLKKDLLLNRDTQVRPVRKSIKSLSCRSSVSFRGPSADRARSRGFALVIVLWISSLLSLLAVGATSSSKIDLRLAENALEQAKARALADAGVFIALYGLMTEPEHQQWQNGKINGQQDVEGGSVLFRISDEDSKIDLNAAPNELLVGIFRASGVESTEAHALVEGINDFRGSDRYTEPAATENDIRLSATNKTFSAIRPFLSVSELSGVIGMSNEIYDRVRDHVTVYADVDGFDRSYASEKTLRALPGMTSELAARIADRSEPHAIPEEINTILERYQSSSRRLIFSIQSTGNSDGGGLFVREAIVALDGGTRSLPFTVYHWKRGFINETP